MHRYLVLNLNRKDDALFFGDKFLTERDKWKKELKEKYAELETVAELSAIVNSEVHSGKITDPTEHTASMRMKVEEQISRLKNYQNLLEIGLSHLTEEQQEIINAFYYTHGRYINSLVHELSIKYSCSARGVYRKKEKAILDFVDVIRDNINY